MKRSCVHDLYRLETSSEHTFLHQLRTPSNMFLKSRISLCLFFFITYCVCSSVHGRHVRHKKRALVGHNCEYGMCEQVDGYPSVEIEKILEKNTDFHSYFGDVIKPAAKVIHLHSRLKGETTSSTLCKTKERTMSPQTMIDMKKEKRLIANVNNFTQVLTYELCDDGKSGDSVSGEEGTHHCSSISLLKHEFRCEQRYHVVKLVTVDPDNQKSEYLPFNIPSTCVCTFKKED